MLHADSKTQALFLHMGPGSHTEIEKEWFGDSLPVHWWNQPRFEAGYTGQAFEETIIAAARELASLFRNASRPIPLIAHSFGAHLALELARRAPEHIASITLLACNQWSARASVGVARKIQAIVPVSEEYRKALASAEANLTPETYWPLFQQLVQIPDFLKHYWAAHSKSQWERYSALALRHSLFDPPTFLTVMGEFLSRPHEPVRESFKGPVTLFLGAEDPAVDQELELGLWKVHFPQLTVEVVPTGHFIHFELEPSRWLPGGLPHPGPA